MNYAIFRVGNKIKDIGHIQAYQNHAERQMAVPNANLMISNRILIGSKNIFQNVKEYIKEIKLRKNNVIARDILLTASPDFFKNATEQEKERWLNLNYHWIKDNFGENCIYAALHRDETTWHITALIVPRFADNKKDRYILANTRYFDGIAKMSAWQDNYAASMQTVFKDLNRGMKFSKAQHIQIKQFYSLLNKEYDPQDLKTIISKAKNGELLAVKIKGLQNTLSAYKTLQDKKSIDLNKMRDENKKLYKNITELQSDKEVYNDTLKALSKTYKISEKVIETTVNYVKSQAKDKGVSLELKK